MENPDFLKQKYNLHNALEVKSAAKRTEKRTGENEIRKALLDLIIAIRQ